MGKWLWKGYEINKTAFFILKLITGFFMTLFGVIIKRFLLQNIVAVKKCVPIILLKGKNNLGGCQVTSQTIFYLSW